MTTAAVKVRDWVLRHGPAWLSPLYEDALAEAHAAGKREGLERAANALESARAPSMVALVLGQVADTLRALAEKPGGAG
jgi:hypothetical protein